MSKLMNLLTNKIKRFWNAYSWLTKGTKGAHIFAAILMIRLIVIEEYFQVLFFVTIYAIILLMKFDSFEKGNILWHIKKEDKNTYHSAKRLSDMEIYGE